MYMIDEFLYKVRNDIKECLIEKKYEDALILIRMSADIAYYYNQFYSDDILEGYLAEISKNILHDIEIKQTEKNNMLFYDGFGLNNRGLIQIYLKALCKIGKVVYVTNYKYRNSIPDVLNILDDNDGISIFIKDESFINQINFVDDIIAKYKPANMFMYTYPHDVVIPVVFNKYAGLIKRYQINLTDHAFWLGKNSFDYCIEFRDWGLSLSYYYRGIDKSKLVMLPYYPNINWEQEFLGYPFPFDENKQRFIFSGGQLYKTLLGGDTSYYKIVDEILSKYEDIIFWYAGSGDRSEMDKLVNKYQDRVYLTEERKDFFQIMQRCKFYLSTYPICGGLMFQYAAAAGKIPITLKNGDFTGGFLFNQDRLKIEFAELDALLKEVDILLNDEKYLKYKNEIMLQSVMTLQMFEDEVKNLVNYGRSNIKYSLIKYDIENFKLDYYNSMNVYRLARLVSRYKKWIIISKYKYLFIWGRTLRLYDNILKLKKFIKK